jgi:hypothetical protein
MWQVVKTGHILLGLPGFSGTSQLGLLMEIRRLFFSPMTNALADFL